MQVTALKPQQREAGRYNVFIDNVFEFSLSDADIVSTGLAVGQQLSDDDVARLRELAEQQRWYRIAVNYVAVRRRSRREISEYLARKGLVRPGAEPVLDRLAESGLIDDLAFGRAWVADRMNLRPRSRRQLEAELQAKGIDRSVVAAVLAEVSVDDHDDALRRVIAKQRRIGRRDDADLTRFLQRQGYGYDQIKRAFEDEALQNESDAI